jgi:hypothetical protein
VAARCKVWICGRSLAGIVGSNPQGHACLPPVNIEWCQVEVSASGLSLAQRSPTECSVSECDGEVSVMSTSWHTRGCCATKEGGTGDVLILNVTLHYEPRSHRFQFICSDSHSTLYLNTKPIAPNCNFHKHFELVAITAHSVQKIHKYL